VNFPISCNPEFSRTVQLGNPRSIPSEIYLPRAFRSGIDFISRQTDKQVHTPQSPTRTITRQTQLTPRIRHKWTSCQHFFSKDEANCYSEMAAQSRKFGRTATTITSFSDQGQFLVVFSLLVIVRLHFALSNSYIHPDEHFQGPEVVVGNAAISYIF
jgi:hypothetical protein